MGPEGGHSLQQGNSVKLLDSDAIGPLRGPIRFLLAIPRPHEVFRPVRPGVKDSQGRWPCAGFLPAKLSPDTNVSLYKKKNPSYPREYKGYNLGFVEVLLFNLRLILGATQH